MRSPSAYSVFEQIPSLRMLQWAETATLMTFGVVSLLIVGVVAALNWALDRLLIEIAGRRDREIAALHLAALVESSDDAIVTKEGRAAGIVLHGFGLAEKRPLCLLELQRL